MAIKNPKLNIFYLIGFSLIPEFLKGGGGSLVKFIYSDEATKFCKIFALLLSYVVPVKSKVKILQNFVAFSEYVNFTILHD